MAGMNVFSFARVPKGFSFAAIICCFVLSDLAAATAIPMKDLSQTMMKSRGRQQQQQHRQKRAVTKTNCTQPDNLDAVFQQINSGMNATQFLQNAVNGLAISIPASETARLIEGDPNETKSCPASVTTDSTAPLAHRSLCPYYFDILQLSEGYYPPTLPWAKCKCQQCLGLNSYGCEAAKTNIAVLKPVGCFQGLQKYEEEIFEVPTSCTCAYTATVQSSSANWGVE